MEVIYSQELDTFVHMYTSETAGYGSSKEQSSKNSFILRTQHE